MAKQQRLNKTYKPFDVDDKKIMKETITTNKTTRLTNLSRNKQNKFNFIKYKRKNIIIISTKQTNYTENQIQAPIQQTDRSEKMERSIKKKQVKPTP